MPCRQTKALDGLLPMPGAPWDLRQHNRAHAGAASNGQGALLQCPQDGVLERRTKHGEAGVIKSASLGALFTLPYGEALSKDRMAKTVYI